MKIASDQAVLDGVLQEFYKLCEIPHGSGNEQAIAAYLTARLQDMGLAPTQDEHLNIVCSVPASEGCESSPLAVVQAHMDMVCAYPAGADYQPLTDPVKHCIKDGILCSDGRSSLGADNGMGIAAALYLLSSQIPHGPLRLIFTTEEEVGLVGAMALKPSVLDGVDYLINTDGFELRSAIVSSSGGVEEFLSRPVRLLPPQKACGYNIRIDGLSGGHSGFDIGKRRGNAIKLLASFLSQLRSELSFELADFDGGIASNAIPTHASAAIVIDAADRDLLVSRCDAFRSALEAQYQADDPGVTVTLCEAPTPQQVWSCDLRDAVLDLLFLLFDGIFSNNPYFPDHIGCSSNLGSISAKEDQMLRLRLKVRFTLDFFGKELAEGHRRLAERCGFAYTAFAHPAHIGSRDNILVQYGDQALFEATGEHLTATATHVGLEASFFHAMSPVLPIITIGPDIFDAHSPDERAPLSGIIGFTHMLAGILVRIAQERA